MDNRVTIREIAQRSGYSRSTVARALKGDPATAEKTRSAVKKWADKLGYQPDPVLSHIGARAWRRPRDLTKANLGFIYASSQQTAPAFDRYLIEELQRHSQDHGYRLEPIDLDADTRRPKALMHNLFHQGMRGMFFNASMRGNRILELPMDRFAVIALGMGHSPPYVDVVRRDTLILDESLWKTILERGYKRIGYAMIRHPERWREECENMAFIHHLMHGGVLPDELHVSLANYVPGAGFRFRRWIERDRLEVVVGFNGGTYQSLLDEGLKIPEEVAFTSIRQLKHNDDVSGFTDNVGEICREAILQLDKKLRLMDFGLPAVPKRTLLRPPWNEGITLPDKKS